MQNVNHLPVLQILNESFDFRVITQMEHSTQFEFYEKFIQQRQKQQHFTALPSKSSLYNELKQTIQNVRDLPERQPELNDLLICQFNIANPSISSVAMSRNLSKIAAGTEASQIIFWDFDLVDQLQYYSSRVVRHWNRIPVRKVASSIDFRFLDLRHIAGNLEQKEEVHVDLENDADHFEVNVKHHYYNQTDDDDGELEPMVFLGHSKAIYEMCFAQPEDAILLSCSGDSTIRSWDTGSGACLSVYQGHSQSVWTVDSNNSGSCVCLAS